MTIRFGSAQPGGAFNCLAVPAPFRAFSRFGSRGSGSRRDGGREETEGIDWEAGGKGKGEFGGGEEPAVDEQIKLRAGPAQSHQGRHVQVLEEMVQDVVGKTREGWRL